MNRNEILVSLVDILKKYDKNVLNCEDEMKIEKLKIEDLSKVQVIMEVERKFDVEFDILDLQKIRAVKDIVDFIENFNS